MLARSRACDRLQSVRRSEMCIRDSIHAVEVAKFSLLIKLIENETEPSGIINEKIETEMEIRTLLTANKNDLNIMILMPVVLMLMLGGMGDMSIVQNTPVNVVIKLTALALFGGAYYMGREIVDIRI